MKLNDLQENADGLCPTSPRRTQKSLGFTGMGQLYSRYFLPSFGGQANGNGTGLERSCPVAGKQLWDGAGWAGETGFSPAHQPQPSTPACTAAQGTGDISTGLQCVHQVMRGDSRAGDAPSTGHQPHWPRPHTSWGRPAGTCTEHQGSLLPLATHSTSPIGLFLIHKWGCLSFFPVLFSTLMCGQLQVQGSSILYLFLSWRSRGRQDRRMVWSFQSLCCKHAPHRKSSASINSPQAALNTNTQSSLLFEGCKA